MGLCYTTISELRAGDPGQGGSRGEAFTGVGGGWGLGRKGQGQEDPRGKAMGASTGLVRRRRESERKPSQFPASCVVTTNMAGREMTFWP